MRGKIDWIFYDAAKNHMECCGYALKISMTPLVRNIQQNSHKMIRKLIDLVGTAAFRLVASCNRHIIFHMHQCRIVLGFCHSTLSIESICIRSIYFTAIGWIERFHVIPFGWIIPMQRESSHSAKEINSFPTIFYLIFISIFFYFISRGKIWACNCTESNPIKMRFYWKDW